MRHNFGLRPRRSFFLSFFPGFVQLLIRSLIFSVIIPFDKLGRWLFDPRSPLNWFTQRRRMHIRAWRIHSMARRFLLGRSGVGFLQVSEKGVPQRVELWVADDETVVFERRVKSEAD